MMPKYKGVDIDTSPTEGMVTEAKRALAWREEFGRGGTEVGVARARDIVNGRNLSLDTVKRMASYFARHEVDKQAEGFSPGEDGYPSAGRVAWGLWGGTPGQTFANKIVDRMDRIDEDERSLEMERPYPNEHAARITDPEQYQGFRRMNDELGAGIDIILGLKDGTSEIQSIRFDVEQFTAEEARQWLSDNGYEPLLFEPALEERAMQRAEPDALKVGDFVSWDSAGGRARGKIERIERDGQINVPGADVVVNGEADDPAALIRVYDSLGNETDVRVAHRFSTLRKIDPIQSEERAMETQERHVLAVTETEETVTIELAKEHAMPTEAENAYHDDEERKASVELTHRSQDMEARAIDEDTRRIRMSISSETPVMRSFGAEVLEHSKEAIDLSFIASGRAPLLLDHDPSAQIGVLESVELDPETRRLRAVARLGKGALAREAFDDIVDGIKSNISIGYAIDKMERKDGDTYVAKSWKPLEASLVSLPADQSDIGIGRSAQAPRITVTSNQKEIAMSDQIDVAAIEAQARKAAEKNAAQIVELGQRHNQSALAQKAIAEGRSIEEFRGELLEVVGSQRALESQDIGMTDKEVKRFSLLRAANALFNPTDRRAQEAAAFEYECSAAASKQYGRASQGIMLPADVLRNWKRDLNTSDDSNVLGTDFRGGEFIDVLRNQSSVMAAGARILNGLQNDVSIPKKATAASATWISAEGGDATASEPTFGSVTLSPKDLAVMTQVTRRMIQQSTLDIEALIRDDIAEAIALGLDLAALAGTGSSGQPTGIKNTSGIGTVDFGTAPDTVPTWAQVIAMETALGSANALQGNLAYILPASMYGALKSVEKAANTAQFVISPDGTMNGYRTIVSNQVSAGDLFFGNFNDALVGMWGGVDLLLDPYTNSASGTVRLRAISTMDFAVRHAASFCLGNDGGS